MNIDRIDEYAGLRRELEIGVRLAPTRASAAPAAKALAAFLDEQPGVPVRLAAIATDESRVLITVAVTLGTVDDIKTAAPDARAAVRLLQRIVDDLAGYDPAFVTLPSPAAAEARLAAHVYGAGSGMSLPVVVRQLVSVG